MLELKDLVAGYGEITALHGLNLKVEPHSMTTVLGANGAGKTTLLRCISGLLRPRTGAIMFQGKNLVGKNAERIVAMGISHVPEGRLIFQSLSVKDNLAMGGYLGRKQQVAEGIERAFSYFPILKERIKQIGGTLSGGEQQMLAIARALILTPKLLLLDEPSMGVAPVIKEKIFQELINIRDHERVTIVLVEQDADVALEVTEYAYVIETGRMVVEGSSDELIDDDGLRKAYLGG